MKYLYMVAVIIICCTMVCCLSYQEMGVGYSSGRLQFVLSKEYAIRAITVTEKNSGKVYWRLTNIEGMNDNSFFKSKAVIYGAAINDFEYKIGPTPLMDGIEYYVEIDCFNPIFKGNFILHGTRVCIVKYTTNDGGISFSRIEVPVGPELK